MHPDEFVTYFKTCRASAILRTDDAEAAGPAMDAAVRGGFRIGEFTLTIPNALDLIREFSKRDDLVVGAGTVLTVDDAERAVEAGAKYLVSPVVDEAMIEAAGRLGVAAMPGTHTPTEMLRAYRAGARLQKLFPAAGIGAKYIKACLGPMPFLNIVPTHGVHASNAASHLKAGAHAIGFVAPLFDPELMRSQNFAGIEERAVKLLAAVHNE